MKYIFIRYIIRSGNPRLREFIFETFDTQIEAINYAKKKIKLLYKKFLNTKQMEYIEEFLLEGQKLWIYEPKSKNTGDEIFIFETNYPERFSKNVEDFLNFEITKHLNFKTNNIGDSIRIEDVLAHYEAKHYHLKK
ncbi:hypothetical protein ma82 [Moumouvirus australiensis]|uniref:Uncharacterized protein n=1 Tax=Moumouvirus australiensis TaxID=2109587 RepID=A0A2P1EKQ6_9VIRU|nr:hypothetical protein QKC55_gp821 [Moumouvirus australiensis]AVL94469.1 hypothetical protein ma82 [Moumouvirus australiensis]